MHIRSLLLTTALLAGASTAVADLQPYQDYEVSDAV